MARADGAATEPDAPAVLRSAFETRGADLRAHVGDGRVVGIVGNGVPWPLVMAVGGAPMALAASGRAPSAFADAYVDASMPEETRALFDLAGRGELRDLALLVCTRGHERLYYFLKELVRRGEGPHVPPLHLFDVIRRDSPAVERYNGTQLALLTDRLERRFGRRVDDGALAEAIRVVNRATALQRGVLEHRQAGRLLGADALPVLAAARFMETDRYAALLDRLLRDAPLGGDPPAGRPRVLLAPHRPAPDPSLHRVIEEAGCVVVSEYDWWGSWGVGQDISMSLPPRRAVLEAAWLGLPSETLEPAATRETWFRAELAEPHIDGVVFSIPPSDDRFGWDAPRLRQAAEAAGKPSVVIPHDVHDEAGRAAVADMIERFADALPARRGR